MAGDDMVTQDTDRHICPVRLGLKYLFDNVIWQTETPFAKKVPVICWYQYGVSTISM